MISIKKVPVQFHDFPSFISSEEAEKLPHLYIDYEIPTNEDKKLVLRTLYSMLDMELKSLRENLRENRRSRNKTRHVCFGGWRGVKSTSVSTAAVGANQGGVLQRNLFVVDIGSIGKAQSTGPRHCVFLFFTQRYSCR